MDKKEWQREKLTDIAWLIGGLIGILVVIGLVCILSSMGWFYQLSVNSFLSFLDEWLVMALIGGILLVPFIALAATGALMVWYDLRYERRCRKKPPEPPDEFSSLYEWLNSKAAGKDP